MRKSTLSCRRCRGHHKRCSREVPTCSSCIAVGSQCSYPPSALYRIQFVDETEKVTCNTTINLKEVQLTRVCDVRMHAEICEEAMTGYMPVMPWEKMKMLLAYNVDLCMDHDPTMTPTTAELALMFGIQAFSRQGHKEISHKLFCKTLDIINQNTDDMNFELAATYYYLGMYVGGRGNISSAIKYLKICSNYLEHSENMFRWVLRPITEGHIMFFLHLRDLIPGVRVPAECITSMRKTVKTHNIEEYTVSVTNLITSWNAQIPVSEQHLKALNITLFSQGAMLQSERANGIQLSALPIAKSITESTRSVYFPMIVPTATTSIVEASYVQTTQLMNDPNDRETIFDLKQNLTALKVIAARAEIVEMMHGPFIEELSTFIERYDAVKEMDFKFDLPHPINTTPTYS